MSLHWILVVAILESTVCTSTTTTSTIAPCKVETWGAIKLRTMPEGKVHMTAEKSGLEVTALEYAFNECVDPESVTFQVFENSNGKCGPKRLGSVVNISRAVLERKTAAITLEIDGKDINADSLGTKAYATTGGVVEPIIGVEICLRASVWDSDVEVLFTEDILSVTYQAKEGIDGLELNVDRLGPDEWRRRVQVLGKVVAYQCDENGVKAVPTITQEKSLLHVCFESESEEVECTGITNLNFTQNGNADERVSAGRVVGRFTEIKSLDKKCQVAAVLEARYFDRSDLLDVLVTGSVTMAFSPRRLQERRLQQATQGSADFRVSARIGGNDDSDTTTPPETEDTTKEGGGDTTTPPEIEDTIKEGDGDTTTPPETEDTTKEGDVSGALGVQGVMVSVVAVTTALTTALL